MFQTLYVEYYTITKNKDTLQMNVQNISNLILFGKVLIVKI